MALSFETKFPSAPGRCIWSRRSAQQARQPAIGRPALQSWVGFTAKPYMHNLNRPWKAHTKVLCVTMASQTCKKGHARRDRQSTMLVFNHDSIPFLVGLLLMAMLCIYVYVLYRAISHYRRV